jgi:hypothetical protein
MRRVSLIAMILVAAFTMPVAAQDRLEDRVIVNTLIGPGFVGDAAVVNMRASAGIKATDWLAVVGEWGTLSKPNDKVISGNHVNGNVMFSAPRPVYYNIRPYATAGVGTFRTADGIVSAGERSDFASNVGAGVTYDFNRWLGVNFDYRRFFIDYGDVRGANRYTFGLNVGLR